MCKMLPSLGRLLFVKLNKIPVLSPSIWPQVVISGDPLLDVFQLLYNLTPQCLGILGTYHSLHHLPSLNSINYANLCDVKELTTLIYQSHLQKDITCLIVIFVNCCKKIFIAKYSILWQANVLSFLILIKIIVSFTLYNIYKKKLLIRKCIMYKYFIKMSNP